MKVGQVCTPDPVTVSASAPLSDAAQLMCSRHVGSVVVIGSPAEHPTALGILTDRDIVRVQLERVADLSRVSVADVMTRNPLVLDEEESIGNAIRHLRARGVRRAPVTGAGGTLVGVVSVDDLLVHVAGELMDLAHLVGKQHSDLSVPRYHSLTEAVRGKDGQTS
jgi:CBS domain-containing protein